MKDDFEKVKDEFNEENLLYCDECQEKINNEMLKIKPSMMFKPKRLAKKFARLVCDECRVKVENSLRKKQRRV